MARFASIDDADISAILKDKNSDNTHKATNVTWNVFKAYLNINVDRFRF